MAAEVAVTARAFDDIQSLGPLFPRQQESEARRSIEMRG